MINEVMGFENSYVIIMSTMKTIPGTLFIHEKLDVYYFLLVLDDEQNIPQEPSSIKGWMYIIYFVLLVLDDEQNIPGTLFIHEGLDVLYTSCWFWTMIRIFLEPSTSTKGWMSTFGWF